MLLTLSTAFGRLPGAYKDRPRGKFKPWAFIAPTLTGVRAETPDGEDGPL